MTTFGLPGKPVTTFLAAILLTLSVSCNAQAIRPPQQAEKQNPEAAAGAQAKEETAEEKQRRLIVAKASAIAERLLSLPVKEGQRFARLRAVNDLAGQVCKLDPGEGVRLFFELAALLESEPVPLNDDAARAALASAPLLVVSSAAACDALLPGQLTAQMHDAAYEADWISGRSPAARSALLPLEAATATLGSDPAKAAALGEQALTQVGSSVWQQPALLFGQYVDLLNALRQKDPSAADRTYANVLGHVRASSSVDISGVLVLAAYPFCPPYSCSGSRSGTRVGLPGGVFVPELGDLRPGFSLDLARAYLDAATSVILLGGTSQTNRAAAYVGANLLLPLVRKHLPERSAALQGAIPGLRWGTGQFRATAEAAMNLGKPTRSPEERLADIENLTDEADRQAAYLDLVDWLSRRYGGLRFAVARDTLERIKNADTRRAMAALVDVREACDALGRNDDQKAAAVAEGLPPGKERALLRAAVAAIRGRADKASGVDMALQSLHDSEQVAGGFQPYVKLAIASVLAKLDEELAAEVFGQAVAGLNQQYAAPRASAKEDEKNATAPDYSSWWLAIPISGGRTYEDYTVEGRGFSITPQISTAVSLLAQNRAQQVDGLLAVLLDTQQLISALPALATALLKQAPALTKPRAGWTVRMVSIGGIAPDEAKALKASLSVHEGDVLTDQELDRLAEKITLANPDVKVRVMKNDAAKSVAVIVSAAAGQREPNE